MNKYLNIILWYRLLRAGMLGKLFHFYGSVWFVAVFLVFLSLCILFKQGAEMSKYGPEWFFIMASIFVVCFGYILAKIFGTLPLLILLVCSLSLATGTENGVQADWIVTAKCASVFTIFFVITFTAYFAAPFPYFFLGYEGWPHRRAMILVLLLSGIPVLELLRVVVGLAPDLWSPWQPLSSFIVEPAWPYTICLWLWFTIGWLLSNYDHELLPPLLRRIGIGSAYEELGLRILTGDGRRGPVPDQLSVDDAYMVDYLLEELPNRPDL